MHCREEPTLRPDDPASTYLLGKLIPQSTYPLPPYHKEPDLPQVESNLNKSPQGYLAVTVGCMEV
jgi:hypothetical protein